MVRRVKGMLKKKQQTGGERYVTWLWKFGKAPETMLHISQETVRTVWIPPENLSVIDPAGMEVGKNSEMIRMSPEKKYCVVDRK